MTLCGAAPSNLKLASVHAWCIAEGLAEESIAGITESPDGYLWLATREGLIRFDGQSFQSFSPAQAAGLHDHGLGAVAASDKALWVGGRDYVGYSLVDQFGSFTKPNFVASRFGRKKGDRYGVASVSVRHDGMVLLWRREGVYKVRAGDPIQPELFLSPPPGESILGFHRGRSGRFWIVTASGLKVREGSQWKSVVAKPNMPASLLEARDGSLWVYTQDVLYQVTPQGTKQYAMQSRVVVGPSRGLLEDAEGGIWAGTAAAVVRVKNGRVERLSLRPHMRVDDVVQAIYQTQDGAIWMGSRSGILARVEAPVFHSLGERHGIQAGAAAAVQEDALGRMWIGSRMGGVYVQDRQKWNKLPGSDRAVLLSMAALGDGSMLGADLDRFWLADEKGIRTVLQSSDSSPGQFRAFSADYGDHIYLSDSSSVYKLNLPVRRSPEKIADIPSVRLLHESKDGLWAVSWDRGLFHLQNGRVTEYPLNPGASVRSFAIVELNARLFLVGSSTGVFAFDRRSRRFVSKKPVFSGDQIFFIQPDASGDLWFAGRKALLRAQRRSLADYFEGNAHAVFPMRLTAKQGLDSTNFGLGVSSIATLSRSGEIWLASQGGAIHFSPEAVLSANSAVKCAIEEITADGAAIPLGSQVRVGPGTRRVQIQYRVLGRRAAENPAFRYRMRGDANTWIETDSFHATFTNLDPGNYTFEVQARAAALGWSGTSASIDISIAPMWHQRWDVRGVGASGLVILLATAIYGRVRRSRRLQETLETRVRLRTEELAKARDEAERSRQRAEAATRVKSEFLANMSHEIRTPLNGVIGMTDLTLQTEINEDQRQLLTVAKLSADALLTLINDILDFSKIEAGKLALDPAPFSVRSMLEDTLKIVSAQARQKGIRLSLHVSPDAPDYLSGDALRLRQILLNLLSNGVKFTSQGTVSVSVGVESRSEDSLLLRFSIADSGIGIAADHHRRIFLAFEQGDSSTTRRHGGTGLGLAISSRLVELMGGRIWVESEPGNGSVFVFTANLAVCAEPPTEQLASLAEELGAHRAELPGERSRCILLAEDNAVNQRVAVQLLKSRGYGVSVAATGREALHAWEKGVFDLILLDVQMPEMDGIEVAREIRRREGGSTHVPIIALTAGAFKEDRDLCLAAGMDDYITKPIITDQFFQRLERWLTPVLSGPA